MLSLQVFKTRTGLDAKAIKQLEKQFKSSVVQALENFSSPAEARAIIKRSEQHLLIDRRVVYQDFDNNRGAAPVTYWKKECRYCRAAFETTNRRAAFCAAPGHRQRYYEQKKSAKLYLHLMDLLPG